VRPDHPRAAAGLAVAAAAGAGGEAPAPDRRHQEQQGHPGNEPERLRARGQRRAARDLRRHPPAGDLLPLRRQGRLFIQISQQIQESSETEKLLLKIDTIKKCLQVDSVDEFNILINDIHKRQQQFLVEEQNIINQNILEDSLLKDNVIKPPYVSNLQRDFHESFNDMDQYEFIYNNIIQNIHEFLNSKDSRKKMLEQHISKG